MIVEHVKLYPGFQWADPLRKGVDLEVEQHYEELQISGLLPRYVVLNRPSDLISQYELAAKSRGSDKPRTTEESPEIRFANADTDEKLISFVRRFGPVVAKCAFTNLESTDKSLVEPRLPVRLLAIQDMQELRNEHLIYRSALDLVSRITKAKSDSQFKFDFSSTQLLIRQIAANIADWPRQWKREKLQPNFEPGWKLSIASLNRIKKLKFSSPGVLLPPELDCRFVICELLNSFPSTVFPNLVEAHRSIKYGIRPLLYSLLKREFLFPREFSFCANTQCRNFFNIERADQQFCSPGCSVHQRQRTYWATRGKKLREKRLRERKKKH